MLITRQENTANPTTAFIFWYKIEQHKNPNKTGYTAKFTGSLDFLLENEGLVNLLVFTYVRNPVGLYIEATWGGSVKELQLLCLQILFTNFRYLLRRRIYGSIKQRSGKSRRSHRK